MHGLMDQVHGLGARVQKYHETWIIGCQICGSNFILRKGTCQSNLGRTGEMVVARARDHDGGSIGAHQRGVGAVLR
jgi:hypothetical protein